MDTRRTGVVGSDTFYKRAPFKSWFFVADTVLLAAASSIDFYILARYYSTLTGPGIVRLLGILFGMWLLWARSFSFHRKVRELLYSPSIDDSSTRLICEQMSQITASATHSAMFFTYILTALLLMQLDYVLGHIR